LTPKYSPRESIGALNNSTHRISRGRLWKSVFGKTNVLLCTYTFQQFEICPFSCPGTLQSELSTLYTGFGVHEVVMFGPALFAVQINPPMGVLIHAPPPQNEFHPGNSTERTGQVGRHRKATICKRSGNGSVRQAPAKEHHSGRAVVRMPENHRPGTWHHHGCSVFRKLR
jgi:hypothetical protein